MYVPSDLNLSSLDLSKYFNQWDPLLNGEGPNVIPDTNVDLTPGASQ